MATRQSLIDVLVDDSKNAKPDSVLAKLMNPLQELARAVRNPATLLPKFKDLVEYAEKNFDAEMRAVFSGVIQRLVDEGEVNGPVWMAMIYNLRRSVDRDLLTRDARHAGLRILHFTDENSIKKYELYMPVLILVWRKVMVNDPETGKEKEEKELVLPIGTASADDLFRKGKKIRVWTPPRPWKKERAYATALPKIDRVPDVRVEMDYADAVKIGALTTCVFYMIWSEMIRIAPTLALNKAWEEGLPDKVRNHVLSMSEDVDKRVQDVGPGVGFVGAHNLAYKYVGMIMTAIMQSGRWMTTIPEKVQLINDPRPRNFSFIFRLARTYQFKDTFPDGSNRCIFHYNKRRKQWLIVSPIRNPFLEDKRRLRKDWDPAVQFGSGPLDKPMSEPTYRTMWLDSRYGFLRSCIEFVWLMGWGDPGSQRDLEALVMFKRDIIDGVRDLASQISDWQIDYAARRPGVQAEEEKKDVDARYDQTGKDKTWCHREFWLQRLSDRYDLISTRRESEIKAMAANNTLTINILDIEWNAKFLWRHLSEEARRAKFLPLYRLAYEVVERVDVAPAFGSETFYRAAAKKLIDEGLYLHLPEDEKAAKKGRLMVLADYCQFVMWAKGSILNNARSTDGHRELLDKGVGFYPSRFMNLELVDRIHEIITAFYEQDKVFVDKFMKLWARRSAFGYTVPINDKDALEQDKLLLNVIGMGCGAEERKAEIELILGTPITLSPEGLGKMRKVEFAWRMGRLWELLKIEEVWQKCGVDVEQEGVSLTQMWLRLIKANDRGVLDKMKTTTDAEQRERLEKSLFFTACQGDFDEHRSAFINQIRKEL